MAYYRDFGRLEHFAASYQHGWAYSGQYSEYRQVRFGNSPAQVRADQFIVCSQNHDQVGNRMLGRRLIELAGWRAARLAAAATLLSPFVPLLFMGEEYGEMARFPYFVSHTDPDLLRAVREGRLAEFAGFINAKALPPDPAAEGTFERSKLNRRLLDAEPHGGMYRYYRRLIELRRSCPELRRLDKSLVRVDISHDARSLIVLRENRLALLLHMSRGSHQMRIDLPPGRWDLLLHSNDPLWGGEGASLPHFIQSGESIVLDNFVAAAYRLRG
jgi:maltooligosyltrehalose trehalohydrolase